MTTSSRVLERREEMRARLVAAAWALAERDGLAALSLRDLAAELGMRAPSLYTYVDGKAAIYDAMFAEGYRELDEAVATVPVDRDDPHGTLTRSVTAFLRFCQASRARYQLLFTGALPDWQPSPEAYAASVASYERMVEGLAELGVHGQDALDLWTALTAGLAAQQLANDPDGDRWVRLVPRAVSMFLSDLTEDRS
ncbi:MAG: TetR/AcrR family transcriptional regulator [Actinobacteria bacterium]|nr:TetR/AcrR family transcriptional regulator [Actinomycetota bacterium]